MQSADAPGAQTHAAAGPADAAVGGQATGADRVDGLRASLTARLDAETLLAQAGALRQAAVRDADLLLAEAQQAAGELASSSQREAERRSTLARADAEAVLTQARADAESIRRRAEADVEVYRRRVREELTVQLGQEVAARTRADLVAVREQSEAMIGDLAASVRILGVALETAQTNVAEMLAALDELRVHAVESLGDPEGAASRSEALLPLDPVAADQILEEVDVATGLDVVVEDSTFDDAYGMGLDEPTDAEPPPTTALDAYLRSAHIDFGDPPLPPVDDTEVGLRYVRDAEEGRGHDDLDEGAVDYDWTAAATRTTAVADTVDPTSDPTVDLAAEAPDTAAEAPHRDKPLGWLFRSTP